MLKLLVLWTRGLIYRFGVCNIKRITIIILGEGSIEKATLMISGPDGTNRIISGG